MFFACTERNRNVSPFLPRCPRSLRRCCAMKASRFTVRCSGADSLWSATPVPSSPRFAAVTACRRRCTLPRHTGSTWDTRPQRSVDGSRWAEQLGVQLEATVSHVETIQQKTYPIISAPLGAQHSRLVARSGYSGEG